MNASFGSLLENKARSLYGWAKRNHHSVNPAPIIVLGNQKAGTSAITHLIADYGRLSKTVDIPESWWPTLEALLSGSLSLHRFAENNLHRFSSDVIKEPNMTFFFSELSKLHPQAQFVFVIRDPRSNIRSILNRLDLPGDQLEISTSDIPEAWKHVFNQRLWKLHHSHYVSLLAERWKKAAEVYLAHREYIYLIRFEDFLQDKQGTIEDAASHLSVTKKKDISDLVDVQYQPRGNRNVSWIDFFGVENLKRINQICGDMLSSFHYPQQFVV